MSDPADPSAASPAWPRSCAPDESPFVTHGASVERTCWLTAAATLPVLAAGAHIFGVAVLGQYAAAVVGAWLGERLCRRFLVQGGRGRLPHLIGVGLLLGMTLPPTVGVLVPLVSGFAAIVVGKTLLGSLGNYLWNPVLVGWAILSLVFPGALQPAQWPFLAADHQGTGSLEAAIGGPTYRGFELSPPPPGVEAWAAPRTVDVLVVQYPPLIGGGGVPRPLLEVFRDRLPPWSDTVWGTVGGNTGETCAVAILAGGLFLTVCRVTRWTLPVGALLAAGVLAAVWPVHIDGPGSPAVWFPLTQVRDGFPVGVALVLFHLTGGGLLAAAMLIAPDPVTTPLTTRGHLWFGIGLGVLTFVFRVNGLALGAAYWALLAMNTVVPAIDRFTRRRVLGT